jgi:hypothetical protein
MDDSFSAVSDQITLPVGRAMGTKAGGEDFSAAEF